MKIALWASAIGLLILIIAFFYGLLVVGIIFFPIIWGITYKAVQKICNSNQ